ncbi:hypothetical protein [Streptomyces sp. TR06-5]|uniref:hypothetical protein n=1 Tax=unclassified Streptomyces TaxID=2593676 RepID=UPI0039A175A8
MTAENQGADAPEGDDPFAYLYRQEGGARDGSAQTPQPGVPRRSYNQVRAVGERQYGARQPQGGPPPAAPYGGYGDGSPNAHYAAPETMPGGRAASRQAGAPGPSEGGRGGGNRNGLLIGAVAVVAAVVVGIGSAMLVNGDDSTGSGGTGSGGTPTAGASADAREQPEQREEDDQEKPEPKQADLPKEDAATFRLGGDAQVQNTVPGAKARNGAYVAGMNAEGSSATWAFDMEKAGTYRMYIQYSVPGKKMRTSLDVNGQSHGGGLNMDNFAHADKGDWAKSWTYTYADVNLKKGRNTVTVSCRKGDKCDVLLDQFWLTKQP